MKNLEKKIRQMAQKKNMDVKPVFVDLLDYVIGYFNPMKEPIQGWAQKYDKEDTADFYAMMQDYFAIMQRKLTTKEWYDAFGDLFMALNTHGNDKGQFFTPQSLCEMMAQVTIDENGEEPVATYRTSFGKRVTISDPSAGSSRCLLAAHAIFIRKGWRKPYLVAEDLDLVCVKMSAINMCVHGCFGEVVQHNTLTEPNAVHVGYIINEAMYPFTTNIPSIRRCDDAKRFVATRVWKTKENAAERKEMPSKADIQSNTPIQLTLF